MNKKLQLSIRFIIILWVSLFLHALFIPIGNNFSSYSQIFLNCIPPPPPTPHPSPIFYQQAFHVVMCPALHVPSILSIIFTQFHSLFKQNITLYRKSENCEFNFLFCAGILKQSVWGHRNRVGIGLSHRPARLHRLAKSNPWNRFPGSLKV